MQQLEQTSQLTPDLRICRVLNGMWQVAGGHGQINHESAISEMLLYHQAGFTTWDMADIYGPAEEFLGDFRKKLEKAETIDFGKTKENYRFCSLRSWPKTGKAKN